MNKVSQTNKKLNVIVIDDDSQWLKEFESDLASLHEFNVTTLTDAEKGLELARSLPADLVIIDMENQASLDGSEVHKVLKEDPELRTIPQVYITNKWAGPDDLHVSDFMRGRTGGMRYIVKAEPLADQLARIVYVLRRWNPSTGECD